MAKEKQISDDLWTFGDDVRVELGISGVDDDGNPFPRRWYVYQAVDVTDDQATSETSRFDEVGVFDDQAEAFAEAANLAK